MIVDEHGEVCRAIRNSANFPGSVVLEIGCGDGRLTKQILGQTEFFAAFDLEVDSLRKASCDCPQIAFFQASGEVLPLSGKTFDIVLFSLSLHHHERPLLALEEACRVLKPGGTLLVLEPEKTSEIERLCAIVNDEAFELELAEAAIRKKCGNRAPKSIRYDWRFSSCRDVCRYLVDYYRLPDEGVVSSEVEAFLGERAGRKPIELEDELLLYAFRP